MSVPTDPAIMQTHSRRLSLERTITGMSAGKNMGFRAGVGLENVARRTLGMVLLGVTVMLWTSSNFLASVSILLLDPLRWGTIEEFRCRD
jgi:hypothetical protein